MIAAHKQIIIHVEYNPNEEPINPNVVAASDAVADVIDSFHFKEVITRKLQSQLTPEQFELIRIVVK